MKTCPVCDSDFPDQHSTCPEDGAVLIASNVLAEGSLVRGKYRIVRKLGQGGMGVVYLAEHLLLGREVALKFLAAELSRNPQFIKRFRNEARAAFQLRHPNIVEVMDLDQAEDGSLFIAMEYVEGPSLRDVVVQAQGTLAVPRAFAIARGVAAGLAAAHAKGTIHRDIKPENILLVASSDGHDHPKVLDFGIAAMLESATALSRTRGLMLTPEYAAPEQWRGMPAAELDGRTDLYALGGMFYEMLTGRTPFHAHNMEGWMFQHLQETPQPPVELRQEIATIPGLNELVLQLLSRDRDYRPASAIDLLSEMHRLQAIESVAQPSKPTAKQAPGYKETVIEQTLTPPIAPALPPTAPIEWPSVRLTTQTSELPAARSAETQAAAVSNSDKTGRWRRAVQNPQKWLRILAWTRLIAVIGHFAGMLLLFVMSEIGGPIFRVLYELIYEGTLSWNPANLIMGTLVSFLYGQREYLGMSNTSFGSMMIFSTAPFLVILLVEGIALLKGKRWARTLLLVDLLVSWPVAMYFGFVRSYSIGIAFLLLALVRTFITAIMVAYLFSLRREERKSTAAPAVKA